MKPAGSCLEFKLHVCLVEPCFLVLRQISVPTLYFSPATNHQKPSPPLLSLFWLLHHQPTFYYWRDIPFLSLMSLFLTSNKHLISPELPVWADSTVIALFPS